MRKHQQPADQVVAELEHLAGTDNPVNIAHRLGFANVDALRQVIVRAGRRDLLPLLHTSADPW